MNNNINPLFTGAYGYALPLSTIQSNGRVYFPDIPVLRNKIITSAQIFIPQMPVTTPDNKSLVSNFYKPDGYVTFCDLNNKEFISNYLIDNFFIERKQTPINRCIVFQNSYVKITKMSDDIKDKYLYFIFFYVDRCYKLKKDVPANLQSVEVVVKDASSRKYYFPDNRILVNRTFTNVLTPNNDSTTLITPLGLSSISTEQVFVSLVYKQDIKVDRIPLSLFYQSEKEFKLNMLLNVDFPSSFVEIAKEATITESTSTILTFQY